MGPRPRPRAASESPRLVRVRPSFPSSVHAPVSLVLLGPSPRLANFSHAVTPNRISRRDSQRAPRAGSSQHSGTSRNDAEPACRSSAARGGLARAQLRHADARRRHIPASPQRAPRFATGASFRRRPRPWARATHSLVSGPAQHAHDLDGLRAQAGQARDPGPIGRRRVGQRERRGEPAPHAHRRSPAYRVTRWIESRKEGGK